MKIDDESIHVHVECKHGFALISGIRDDTLQPACFKENCRKQGEIWLQSQGLMASDEVGGAGAVMADIFQAGSVFFSQPLVIETHEYEEMDQDEVAWKREEGDSFVWKDAELPIRSQPLMWGTMPQGELQASMSTAVRQTENGAAADLAQEDADVLKHDLDEAGSVGAFVKILMGSNVGGKLFTKVMDSQHLDFNQKHYVKKTTVDRSRNWDHLFLDGRQVWRPCEVLEEISGSQVRLRFRCGHKIKETRQLVPFVASMVDQCCTAADFKKWKGSIAQMSKSSLQRVGETAGFGMMPVKTQAEKLLQADAFKMRGAAMGQHALMDDFFRTDEAQQVLQKRLDQRASGLAQQATSGSSSWGKQSAGHGTFARCSHGICEE